jgi:uncharacterized membrane protein YagU involved in acid resistance
MYKTSFLKSIIAGLLGAAAMSLIGALAPLMGMPEMNVPKMLAMTMGTPLIVGWAAHLMIGTVLALSYAVIFYKRIPGNGAVKGLIFSLIPWLMAQVLVMPMMTMINGMPFTSGLFSGSAVAALGSLIGHLFYGLTLGLIYKPEVIGNDISHSFTNA